MSDLPLPTCLTTNSQLKTRKDRVIEAQFGQGFKQITRDGIKAHIPIWHLEYKPLTGTDLQTVRDFYNLVGSDVWFYWTVFGESTARKWRIVKDSVQEKMFNFTLIQISFDIEESFDLGTPTPPITGSQLADNGSNLLYDSSGIALISLG